MKIEARVERDGFFLNGRKRSIDTVVHVSIDEWERFGSPGTAQLAFIRERPDLSDPADADVDATTEAKLLAMREGIDLTDVEGTGKGGRVLVGDVRDHVE